MSILGNLTRFRGVFLSTFFTQCLIFGVQFAGSVLIVKTLAIHDYATYILFNTTLILASNFANLGLRSYLVRFTPGAEPEKARRILWSVIGGQFGASLILIFASLPLLARPPRDWLDKFQVAHLPLLFSCFAGALLISFMPRQFSGYFRYLDEDYKSANRIQMISGTAFPVFIVIASLTAGTLGLSTVLAAVLGSHVLSVAAIFAMSRGRARFPGYREALAELKPALAYSWPFALLPFATQLIESGNRYFLAGFATPVDLAKFSFNYGICNAGFNLINTSLGFTYFPTALKLFNQGRRKEAVRLNFKGVMLGAAAVSLFFAAFWAASGNFFRLLDRESLRMAALPFSLICLSFLAQSLMQHGGFLLQVYDKRISSVGIMLAGTAISLALNFLLVSRFQATGAALALCLTSCVLLILNLLPVFFIRKEASG